MGQPIEWSRVGRISLFRECAVSKQLYFEKNMDRDICRGVVKNPAGYLKLSLLSGPGLLHYLVCHLCAVKDMGVDELASNTRFAGRDLISQSLNRCHCSDAQAVKTSFL